MKSAEGFLTEDGQFFELGVEAELHEAEIALRNEAESHGFNPESVMSCCENFPSQIVRYIHAVQSAQAPVNEVYPTGVQEHSNQSSAIGEIFERHGVVRQELHARRKDNTGTKETAKAVQQQQVSRTEPVSYLRRGLGTEEVRNYSKVNGARMRDSDASSVRSGEDMATGTPSTLAQALRKRRLADIREEQMAEDNPGHEEDGGPEE